jgi:hypothetical protein
MNATDVRTKLGSRFDAPTLVYGKPLVLYGRVAWAHDFVSNPALSAVFQSLPSAGFTVFGAPIPHDSALTTAGAQLYLTPQWTLIAKFLCKAPSEHHPVFDGHDRALAAVVADNKAGVVFSPSVQGGGRRRSFGIAWQPMVTGAR